MAERPSISIFQNDSGDVASWGNFRENPITEIGSIRSWSRKRVSKELGSSWTLSSLIALGAMVTIFSNNIKAWTCKKLLDDLGTYISIFKLEIKVDNYSSCPENYKVTLEQLGISTSIFLFTTVNGHQAESNDDADNCNIFQTTVQTRYITSGITNPAPKWYPDEDVIIHDSFASVASSVSCSSGERIINCKDIKIIGLEQSD